MIPVHCSAVSKHTGTARTRYVFRHDHYSVAVAVYLVPGNIDINSSWT